MYLVYYSYIYGDCCKHWIWMIVNTVWIYPVFMYVGYQEKDMLG